MRAGVSSVSIEVLLLVPRNFGLDRDDVGESYFELFGDCEGTRQAHLSGLDVGEAFTLPFGAWTAPWLEPCFRHQGQLGPQGHQLNRPLPGHISTTISR